MVNPRSISTDRLPGDLLSLLWHARRVEFPGYRRVGRRHFERPVLEMAPLLLGSLLVHVGDAGRVGFTGSAGDGPRVGAAGRVGDGPATRPGPTGTDASAGADTSAGADASAGAGDSPETGGIVAVRLTEVEAYGGSVDPGSHSFRGRTERNATMFGEPGHLYCYFTYGMHHALNIVCDAPGIATGCLLRAGEVTAGLELAHRRREALPGRAVRQRLRPLRDVALARGPGNLASVFGATRTTTDGADLCLPTGAWQLWVPNEPLDAEAIRTGPRVGVSGEGGNGDRYPWRFWLPGEPTVSAYRAAVPRT